MMGLTAVPSQHHVADEGLRIRAVEGEKVDAGTGGCVRLIIFMMSGAIGTAPTTGSRLHSNPLAMCV
jgi:hypothetical protein